ncbi:carboxymuconolactone decarboxylase family protein [Streptomyces sp. S3(2020)]|uniref:carboxymuconolactone decarboxylase family protein n=1 Tax=Streptomyces sp. S3(2020) TaxID=2732044 RepID=UPI00148899FB|nr:carboxymuconolactone decarboxylase family protein [Streptomyces sp. S3(2020)]NNN32273.1 carboxymuconolactone decarboxylase family protein [Streptomyces sp. S3(2020)]
MDYPDLTELPDDLRKIAAERSAVNVYRMVFHSPALAPAFLQMADAIFQGALPHPLRELAILRVGHTYRAPYEIHHHENIGRLLGLDEVGIAAAGSGSAEGLTTEQAAVLSLTDRLLEQHTLTETDRAEALSHLTTGQLSDLVLTVGFYQLVCNFLNTFDVTTEGEKAPY